MKKLAAVLFSLLLVASVSVGCAKKTPDPVQDPDTDINTPADPDDDTTDPDDVTPGDDVTDPDGDKDDDTVTPPENDDNTPDTPDTPDVPDVPDNSEQPEQPEQPEVPTPDTPSDLVPVAPENPDGEQTPSESINLADMTLSDIVDKIYEAKSIELSLVTASVDLTNTDILKYMTGLDSADKVKEAVVSEPMIGSIPYSLVLVRVNNSADAAAVAESMKNGIDTRKWVCVEADDLGVAYKDDLVLLFMIGSDYTDVATSAEMLEAFNGLGA